jgi:hypothetical protein
LELFGHEGFSLGDSDRLAPSRWLRRHGVREAPPWPPERCRNRAAVRPRPRGSRPPVSREDAEQDGEEGEAHDPGEGEQGGGGSHDGPEGDA